MDLLPRKENSVAYPNRSSFFSLNREFLAILTSLGIGTVAIAEDPPSSPRTECSKSVLLPVSQLQATVDALCKQLNHESYKTRKDATTKLIQIGKGTFSSKKEQQSAKTLVLNSMAKMLKHSDPEVSARAGKVRDALTVKPVPPPPRRVKGIVRMPGF